MFLHSSDAKSTIRKISSDPLSLRSLTFSVHQKGFCGDNISLLNAEERGIERKLESCLEVLVLCGQRNNEKEKKESGFAVISKKQIGPYVGVHFLERRGFCCDIVGHHLQPEGLLLQEKRKNEKEKEKEK